MRDRSHLAVSAERDDEVRPRGRQHEAMVGEGRRPAHLGRASGDETGIGILDTDELHVGHGDEMPQVGGVVERVPVAHLDGRNTNGHGRSFLCAGVVRNVYWRLRT